MIPLIRKSNQKIYYLPFFSLFVSIICILLLLSCGDGKKETNTNAKEEGIEQTANFILYGIKYDSSIIQKWINDTSNYRKFVFQYETDNLNKPAKNLMLVAYVQNKDRNWVSTTPEKLSILRDSSYRLSGDVILGNTEKSIPFIARILKKADGSTISYDHIFLKPIIRSNHLTYAISIIKNNTRVIEIMKNLGDEDELNPVPPGRPEEK